MAREQFLLLLLEPEATLAAIPKLLPADVAERRKGLAAIRNVLSAAGEISGEAAERLKKVAALFEVSEAGPSGTDTDSRPFRSESRQSQGVVAAAETIGSRAMSVVPIDAGEGQFHSKYERLVAAAKQVAPAVTMVVHPCDEASLRGVCEAAAAGIIKPVLVGPCGARSRRLQLSSISISRASKLSMLPTVRRRPQEPSN